MTQRDKIGQNQWQMQVFIENGMNAIWHQLASLNNFRIIGLTIEKLIATVNASNRS